MKVLAVALILFDMAWNGFLEILDSRSLKNSIPKCVSDVYDADEYNKWRAYKGERKRIGVIASAVNLAVILCLVGLDAFAKFASFFPKNVYAQLFGVVLFSSLADLVIGLPFSWYSVFRIEEKYGFNRRTVKTFVLDQVKSFFVGLVLNGALISLFAFVHRAAGNVFIPVFAAAFTLVMLAVSTLYPFFTRLFNKFVPLEEGELKQKLTALLTGHGYKVRAVEIMDASRRTTKMNAYFAGIGPTKRIVLYDTMKEAMTDDQIVSVFAHEMGHGLHHDIVWRQIFSVMNAVLIACIAWFVLRDPAAYADFGFDSVNYGMAFMMIGWLMSVVSPLFDLLTSTFSRRAEYRADATAVDEGYGKALVSALKLLAKKNLADLSPDPLLVKLTYSHPTLAQRIEAIEKKITANQ